MKQESEKSGKKDIILSTLFFSYRNEFFSDLKISKTEREDLNFDFFIHLMNHKELWLGEIF